MSPEEILEEAVQIAARLCSESRLFETDGESVSAEFAQPVDESDLYHALKEADRRGLISAYWPGGMALPEQIRTS